MKKAVGIIGSGIIASSTAVLTTGHGYPTWVLVRSDEAEERLWKKYREHFERMVKNEILTSAEMEVCTTYLHVTQHYEEMSHCRIFMEAVAEVKEVKASVFEKIAANSPDVEMILSASSAITPEMMLEPLKESPFYGAIAPILMIAHPFNPVHMVPYFEVCGSKETREGLTEEVCAFLKSLDREPVVLKKPTPGFIGNRLQFALFREAMQLVSDGVCDFEDIDRALRFSFCPRYTSIGLFEHMDYAGLDLDAKNCKLLFPLLSDAKETPALITERLAAGKGGTAQGEGFYDWRNRDMEAYAERVNAPYWQFCKWNFPEERYIDS